MELIYFVMEKLLPFSWVEFNFMKNALLSVLLISPLFGLIGTMIVNNKMSFFSDAMGHCALTGISLGIILGIDNYIVSVLGFAFIFALGISSVMESGISSSDTIIGVFSSVGVALGILILSIKGGFAKYSGYLIGDILSISKNEIFLLAVTSLITFIIWIVCFNKLMLASLHTEMAKSKQINVRLYKSIFTVLIAFIVTMSIKWVGMLIINSLLVLPAASAKNIAKNVRNYHIISVVFSLFSAISGLIISFYCGTSAGATIVLISAIIFFVTFFINKALNMN